MLISILMESISELWPFSRSLEWSDEGYFVNPQTSDNNIDAEANEGEGTDMNNGVMAHETATVSLATFEDYVPGSCLTVSLSRLRSNHSSQPGGFLACQDNTIPLGLRQAIMTTSQAEPRRLLQSVPSHTETPASTEFPVTMSPVRSR